ncbi:MAG: two-component regulator propeller domain-containing protein [Cellvibrio sp.]|uniref:two-component regulator propeller domain-containing protein n=1 Tax=Cellvibrio sp. TaxID=1965322 RepID=UPI00271F4ADE|nr:two-component regulator propeller domain-containing protein [Cellvibrio sp.]
MTKRFALLLIIAVAQFALTSASYADAATADSDYPKKIHFRNIMQNQDIALGEVESIIQDYQGFMWLGGRNALLRYDGYEFLPIPAAKDPSNVTETAPVNQVLELLEDKHHNLWAATRSGLYRYDRDHEILLPVAIPDELLKAGGAINAIAESPTGDILIGTATGFGILNKSTGGVEILNQQNGGLPSNLVGDILMGTDNTVWLGLDSGLAQMDLVSRKITLHTPNAENPKSTLENTIRTVAIDHAGRVWAGSNVGIYRLDRTTNQFVHYQHDAKDPTSLPIDFSWQIYVDRNGWVWVGSDGGGLSLYHEAKDSWATFNRSDGGTGRLSSNIIRRIYEDRTGDIWVGTYPSGVHIYDRSSAAIRVHQKSVIADHGPMDNNVEALLEDNEGNIWIGSQGVSRFDPKTDSFTHYAYTTEADSRVAAPAMLYGTLDSEGRILFGTWGAGVQVYNPETDRFDTLPVDPDQSKSGEKIGHTLNDLMVWNVFEDRQRNLWFSTHYNGLTKFDRASGLYSFYSHSEDGEHSLSSAVAWVSYEDSQGRFWVGTAYGLNLLNRENNTFKRYLPDDKNPRSLANGSVLAIHEDSKKRLWFGTDMGLHLYHPETDDFTHYDTHHGFADHGIRAITQDRHGNLWLGTNNGVVRFNPDTLAVKNYTRFNGELIGGIATGAAIATRSGEIAFGSRNGLYFFDVDRLESNQNRIPPAVAITDFRLFTQKVAIHGRDKLLNKVITQTDSITLDYTQSMISFSFAALNYRDTEKNLHAYKLEGFDSDWRQVGNQRTALYTNLPAGTYQFRVKASNNDGIWNEKGRSIQLVILPPPWKTWWAYTIYAAIIIGLLLLFVRNQHQKVVVARNISRELEHKVAERTAELQNKNAELEGAYAQLEAISLSDPLTGLNNRRYLQKLIPMDIAKVQRDHAPSTPNQSQRKISRDLTFFILDVDFFKSVNDLYGHAAGDQLLIQLSDVLTKICRESDCVVRWGGEEFLIVSRFADRDEAPLMAERIRKSIEHYNFILPDGSTLKKTCSIGFSSFPFLHDHPMTLSWEQVIDIADRALYAAKKSGRNLSVGIAANTHTEGDQLYQRISSGLPAMIVNKELTVITPTDKPLVWD